MTGNIKEENLQGKTHCVIEKMRDKEEKSVSEQVISEVFNEDS
jgi:hypothetical protein